MAHHRPESKSPPRLQEDGALAESKSPQRPGHISQPGNQPRPGHRSRPKSKFQLCQVEENMLKMTFTQHQREHRDSSDTQSRGCARTHNTERISRTPRRATPTPSQRPAPAEFDLHAACWAGNMAVVKRIMSQGQSDIDGIGGLWRTTPVMAAAWHGHVDVVKLLVTEGANVSLEDSAGDNILHYACYSGLVELVKFVLSEKMADVNSRGEGYRTPVMAAAWYGHREVVELLIREGADVSLVDSDSDNILHWACEGGDVEMVKFVLSQEMADINSRGKESRTPVMEASLYKRREVVELLVRAGAVMTLVDDAGNSILHLACEGKDEETVKFVLSLNVVDINARNKKGQNVADVARDKEHQEMVHLLVSHGAQ
ncbi:serine/threonine-protein phosphatase 6 regulatory ankyrin repeat subunit A-like [Haliotis rufescens]|uniref:serine/threonine-protein phosphatase 6 regulatory ankyrin repeat subunit A-like n=1 Tax=Haliotis rufescens TaxID=6454 RepID=UPI00201EF561|nr:serine/threonine-protein phosphatase 6 regulatory ankyrin repeat subunit A-like [Haliotis rufescens]XP_048249041.1 serine/threonine-protein phosphatase 6 regulatory ankyrin repeat subunit A-like [Haliotis rufescens]XP_048249042.1 serine/threonine-protein phosphatase 6 regulatory ankyrin repeat subunit A-like [Haliotis rufescens]